MNIAVSAVIGILASTAALDTEENWPHWRGPHLDGTSRAAGLPLRWSPTENVRWKTPLPTWAGATPIVWGDAVFVTSASPESGDGPVSRALPRTNRKNPGGDELLLICVDRRSGDVRWQKVLGAGNTLYGKQNMASPSPVTDGKTVWALTGTGILCAFTFDGEPLWRHDLQGQFGEFTLQWGYGSSPTLVGDLVVVQILHGSNAREAPAISYLLAFDGKSGELRWKQERKSPATRECPDAYTTPILWNSGSAAQLIVSGADVVTGHDPKTGAELWRGGGLNPENAGNYRIVASPVVVGDLLITPSRVRPVIAWKLGAKGELTDSHRAWTFEDRTGPDVPTPVSDGQRVYLVNDRGMVTCLDLKSGETVWGPERTRQGTVSASPLLADGRVYVTNEDGVTTVLRAGPTFEVLAENDLEDEYTISSIAVGGRELFIRTSKFLYCIGAGER